MAKSGWEPWHSRPRCLVGSCYLRVLRTRRPPIGTIILGIARCDTRNGGRTKPRNGLDTTAERRATGDMKTTKRVNAKDIFATNIASGTNDTAGTITKCNRVSGDDSSNCFSEEKMKLLEKVRSTVVRKTILTSA